jgi:hypothetical protein
MNSVFAKQDHINKAFKTVGFTSQREAELLYDGPIAKCNIDRIIDILRKNRFDEDTISLVVSTIA